jgi:hypothetical protein
MILRVAAGRLAFPLFWPILPPPPSEFPLAPPSSCFRVPCPKSVNPAHSPAHPVAPAPELPPAALSPKRLYGRRRSPTRRHPPSLGRPHPPASVTPPFKCCKCISRPDYIPGLLQTVGAAVPGQLPRTLRTSPDSEPRRGLTQTGHSRVYAVRMCLHLRLPTAKCHIL